MQGLHLHNDADIKKITNNMITCLCLSYDINVDKATKKSASLSAAS